MSQRETIISALEALLKTTGYSVELRPVDDFPEPTAGPILRLLPQPSTIKQMAGRVIEHTLEVYVEAGALTAAAADSAMAAVLTAIAGDPTLGGLLNDHIDLTAADEATAGAHKIIHGRRVTLAMRYETAHYTL